MTFVIALMLPSKNVLTYARSAILASVKVQRASHCVYQVRYHMIFCIKYRRSLLVVEERCDYLKRISKRQRDCPTNS
jgi:hypothetical protein